ncbi:MAG: glutamine--fructose-6-phosphate transaminase (isomerizing) [candidate division WOR-3 bacterium]
MCGIVGYLGERDVKEVILVSLERLEYRGYDSCGLAIREKDKLKVFKVVGRLPKLKNLLTEEKIEGSMGIGHTRWATHGRVDENNAHPLTDCSGEIAIVHNGIIENYRELREELEREGHTFKSETDSEVIAHLLEKYNREGNLFSAFQKTAKLLKGTFAILVLSQKEPILLGAKIGSPLLVGFSKKDKIIASDILALVGIAKEVFTLEDFEIAFLTQEKISFFDFEGKEIRKRAKKIDITPKAVTKGKYPHYMRKEIFEQPKILRENIKKRILPTGEIIFDPETRILPEEIRDLERILIFACGTSYHAGLIARDYFERFAQIPTQVEIASELANREIVFKDKEKTLGIAISQSGETIDTLFALRMLKNKGIKVLAVCNVKRSSIDRESDATCYINCGPEIGVASTKAYTAQLFTLLLLSLYFGEKRGNKELKIKEIIDALKEIPEKMERVLKLDKLLKEIAQKNWQRKDFLFLGRGINYPQALEGALKLKEISYIHATGYPAGEMKHGPIALLSPEVGVVAIVLKDFLYDKMLSNLNEVKSRGAKIIAIAEEGDEKIKELADYLIFIPPVRKGELLSPLISIIPLQLLAYHIAVLRGCDVDKPRHLAKSVVVE